MEPFQSEAEFYRLNLSNQFLNMSKKGFTLIELLVAATIFAVVMASLFAAFRSGVLSSRNTEKNIQIYQTARLVLEQIDNDLRNSFAYRNNLTGFSGTENELSFFTLVNFYRDGRMSSEFGKVNLYSSLDREDRPVVLRKVFLGLAALEGESDVEPEIMAEEATLSFRYGYLSTGKEADGLKFKDSWAQSTDNPEEEKEKLPVAVEVSLSFKSSEFPEKKFQRTIFIPMAR